MLCSKVCNCSTVYLIIIIMYHVSCVMCHISCTMYHVSCFSIILARTGSVVTLGHFFYGPDGPTKFRWKLSKIKGTYTSDWGVAWTVQKQRWDPKNDPQLGNGNFFGPVEWEHCSPGYTWDMLCWQKLWLPKNWLFAPNIQIFGSKKHIFAPGDQFEPQRSMFSTPKRCLIGFLIWGYKKFYSLPPKIGILAQKRLNLVQNWHFWPNIGLFGSFDPMPDQKQCGQVA